jgi:hypothetical protein
MGGDASPAFMFLAGDVRLSSLSLGFQRIEGLLQAFLGRFSGVDRAMNY